MSKLLTVILLVFATQGAFSQESSSLRGFDAELFRYREISDCKLSQARYLFLENDLIQCTENYILYEAPVKYKKTSSIKMAAFNILRTGTNQTRFKKFDYVARIINQWDLVTAVEIMPTPNDVLEHNDKIDSARTLFEDFYENFSSSQKKLYKKQLDQSYDKPGYIRILEELRKLDPAWSLILAPYPTGDHPTSYELSGYFYRASVVESKETSFCDRNRGCLLPIKNSLNRLISRQPFVARFVSGDLDFNAVAVHMRFREPPPDCNQAQVGEKCTEFTNSEKSLIKKFEEVGSKTDRFRFIELAIINESIKDFKGDFAVMGDFNLDYDPEHRNEKFWMMAMEGTETKVLIEQQTSISEQNGLSNPYDHFLLESNSTSSLNLCSGSSAGAFNFLIDDKSSAPSVLRDLSQFLKRRKTQKKTMLKEYSEMIAEQKIVSTCTSKSCEQDYWYSDNEAKDLSDGYWQRVLIDSDSNISFPYRVHIELISDHLPIYISCKTH